MGHSLFSQHEKQTLLPEPKPKACRRTAVGCACELAAKPVINFMNATAIRDENVFDATMTAMIIYDKCDSAAKAKEMLERVAHRTDERTHWSVMPWRADMLKLSPTAEVALAEAAEAHLILLAVRQVQSLLPWLVDWLERWAKQAEDLAGID
jgi:lysyl-tRNA synthetase class I